MQKVSISGYPMLLEDWDAQQQAIEAAIRRTWLMFGGVITSVVCLVIYVLAFSK